MEEECVATCENFDQSIRFENCDYSGSDRDLPAGPDGRARTCKAAPRDRCSVSSQRTTVVATGSNLQARPQIVRNRVGRCIAAVVRSPPTHDGAINLAGQRVSEASGNLNTTRETIWYRPNVAANL